MTKIGISPKKIQNSSEIAVNSLEYEAQKLASETLIIDTIAVFPGKKYPIDYGKITEPDGACVDLETRFRSRLIYEAKAQSLNLIRSHCIIDTKFGTPLIHDGGRYIPVDGAFYHPYLPGKQAYIEEVNETLSASLSRGRVLDLRSSHQNSTIKFCLLGRWSKVYFHMLSESLTHLNVIKKYFSNQNVAAIVIDDASSVQDIAISASRSSGFSEIRSNNRYIIANNVAYYTGFFQHASINDEFLDMINALKSAVIDTEGCNAVASHRERLIYVSRLTARARPLENEAEITRIASDLGYEVVDPGKLSFREQIFLFSSASVVVGPHGAGLANASFCSPGGILLELRPMNRPGQSPMLNETYRKIAAAGALSYNFCIFENEKDSERWRADGARVARALTAAREVKIASSISVSR